MRKIVDIITARKIRDEIARYDRIIAYADWKAGS